MANKLTVFQRNLKAQRERLKKLGYTWEDMGEATQHSSSWLRNQVSGINLNPKRAIQASVLKILSEIKEPKI